MNNTDKLQLWEKLPLALLMAAQALIVFRWYAANDLPLLVQEVMPWITTLFAVAAAVALDLVVVTTTMGRREGRESIYGMLTSASAATFSALVALDIYGVFPFGAWLHAAFPVTTFVYAQHLAVRHQDVPSEPMTSQDEAMAMPSESLLEQWEQRIAKIEALAMPSDAKEEVAYQCPPCGIELPNKQAKASAVSHGYCRHCKPANGNGANGHTGNGNGHGEDEDVAAMDVIASVGNANRHGCKGDDEQ
jgi:hypothetical protein